MACTKSPLKTNRRNWLIAGLLACAFTLLAVWAPWARTHVRGVSPLGVGQAPLGNGGALLPGHPGTNSAEAKRSSPAVLEGGHSRESLRAPSLLVLDSVGRPVPGLLLGGIMAVPRGIYELERDREVEPLGRTDSAGQLVLREEPTQRFSVISLDPKWLVVGSSMTPGNWQGECRVRVRKGGVVQGVVLGPSGPVRGAIVGALVTTDFFGSRRSKDLLPGVFDQANVRRAVTGSDGRFELGGLLAMSSRLDVLAPGCVPKQVDFRGPSPGAIVDVGAVRVSGGVDVRFVVTRGGDSLSEGHLFLEALDGTFTRGNSGLALSDIEQLLVHGMKPGLKFRWMIEEAGGVGFVGEAQVPIDGGEVALVVPESTAVRVYASSAVGDPIEAFSVIAKEGGGRKRRFEGSRYAEFERQEGVPFRVKVEAVGFVTTGYLDVSSDVDHIEVQLSRTGRLSVVVQGADGLTAIDGATVHEKSAKSLSLIDQGLSPVALEGLSIVDGRVEFPSLAPGEQWLVLALGARIKTFGPFVVRSGEATVAEIALPHLEWISGTVRDASSGQPLADVSVRIGGPTGMSSTAGALFAKLVGTAGAAAVTGPNGEFRLLRPQDGRGFLSFEAAGYASRTRSVGADTPGNLEVVLDQVSAASIRLDYTLGVPASNARVSFVAHGTSHSGPIESVELNEEGWAAIELVRPGLFAATVHYANRSGVSYRVGLERVEVQVGVEFAATLLPESGTIALTQEGLLPGSDFIEIQIVSNPGAQRFVAEWSRTHESESCPGEIRVEPGAYRIRARSATGMRFGECIVAPGGVAPIDWLSEAEYGDLALEVRGSSWAQASFRVESEMGFREVLNLERGGSRQGLLRLPMGQYKVKLFHVVQEDGTALRLSWVQTGKVSSAPSSLVFDLKSGVGFEVVVVDDSGSPIGSARVESHGVISGRPSSTVGVTDPLGRVTLHAPMGAMAVCAFPIGYAPVIKYFDDTSSGGGTLICDRGGTIEVQLPNDPKVVDWEIVLFPDPPPRSQLEAMVLGQVLQGIVSKQAATLDAGQKLVLTRIPNGVYSVSAIEATSGIVSTAKVNLVAGDVLQVDLVPVVSQR